LRSQKNAEVIPHNGDISNTDYIKNERVALIIIGWSGQPTSLASALKVKDGKICAFLRF